MRRIQSGWEQNERQKHNAVEGGTGSWLFDCLARTEAVMSQETTVMPLGLFKSVVLDGDI